MQKTGRGPRVSRRQLLKSIAIASGALAGKAVLQSAPVFAGAPPIRSKTMNILAQSGFIKPVDEEMARQAEDWAKQNDVTIKWERITSQNLPDRLAAAVMTQAGPDMVQYNQHFAHLYRENFADVSDVAEEASKAVGGFFKDRELLCKVDGVWRAVPIQYTSSYFHYRSDWLKQAQAEVPSTFDQYIESGRKMKKWGKPFGEATSHEPADAGSFWYTWLWAYGGKEVQADGKTVAINSPETLEAVEKGVVVFDQFIQGVLSWDGASNNRAYYAGAISGTHNGLTLLVSLKTSNPQVDAATRIAPVIAGPKGRPTYIQAHQWAVFSYSKNINLAKDLIRHLSRFENLRKYIDAQGGYAQGCGPKMIEGHPVWDRDPRLLPVKESSMLSDLDRRWPGWPGPPSKAAMEAQMRFIIIDMFAKAASREMTPKEAIAWAEGQLKAIYSQA